MSTDIATVVKDFITSLISDRDVAQQYAADPEGTLAAQGISEHSLEGVDVRQLVGEACGSVDLSPDARSALQSYSGGGGPSVGGHNPPPVGTGPQSVEQVVQQLDYVTYVTYQDDHSITTIIDDHSTNIDQSSSIDVDGTVLGDIAVDGHNSNATGDQAQAIAGDNYGQANTGDGAVQVGGDNDGALNTGVNTGVMAGGGVSDTVVGDGNRTANVDGSADGSTLSFGSGNSSNSSVSDSSFGEGATTAVGGSSAQGGTTNSGNTSDSGNTTNVDRHDTHDSHDTFDSHDVDIETNDSHDTSVDSHDTDIDTTKIDSHDNNSSTTSTSVDTGLF